MSKTVLSNQPSAAPVGGGGGGPLRRLIERWNNGARFAEIIAWAIRKGNTGGIWKRVDENRELLEELQRHCPTILNERGWIESWIQSNDAFFVELAGLLELHEPKTGLKKIRPFPATAKEVPRDELAALRQAVTLMGFDASALAAAMVGMNGVDGITAVLGRVRVDQLALEREAGDASSATTRDLLDRICLTPAPTPSKRPANRTGIEQRLEEVAPTRPEKPF